MKKYRFHIGLTLLVQSASFVVLFFMLYRKKKSLASTFLALSAIGGIAGAYLVLKEAKSEVEACEQAALLLRACVDVRSHLASELLTLKVVILEEAVGIFAYQIAVDCSCVVE